MARQALFSLVFRSIIFLLKCSFCYFLDLKSEATAQRIRVGSKGTFGLLCWLVQSEVVPLDCAGLLV